jgi:hypothetical protein
VTAGQSLLEEAVERTGWAARELLLFAGTLLGSARSVFTKVAGKARVVILKCCKIYKTTTILHFCPRNAWLEVMPDNSPYLFRDYTQK